MKSEELNRNLDEKVASTQSLGRELATEAANAIQKNLQKCFPVAPRAISS